MFDNSLLKQRTVWYNLIYEEALAKGFCQGESLNMGFSNKTLDFLIQNHIKDSRDWFEQNKERYTEFVLNPLRELVDALAPQMLQIDSEFVTEPRVDKTICRIRRDTRFSHDKSLYRDHMWIIFKRGKMHGTEVPGYYFEVSPAGFSYGCGFYCVSTAYMTTLRRLVLENNPVFCKAQAAFLGQELFQMEGDCFKRPHYPNEPEEKRQWLERRGICFTADHSDFELLYSKQLPGLLVDGFARLAPVYQFLLHTAEVLKNESI